MENLEMNRQFWKNKKVFITGHTGFKGGWLSLWLQRMGATVTGYALPPHDGACFFRDVQVGTGMTSLTADIRDADQLITAMGAAQPDIAFHLAAQPLVRTSYAEPAETYAINVMGTVNFLEAVRNIPSVRAAVVVTSDKCYENHERKRGYREDEAMGGADPYSSSKGCAELVTAAYRRSFFANDGPAVATARAGNVIGGGDWAHDRLIPDMVRAFAADEPIKLRFPNAVRPWQHVLEPLKGYLILAERLYENGPEFARGWNFGPREEDAWRVLDVVKTGARIWGNGARWSVDGAFSPHEAKLLRLDCSQARTRLGWMPVLDLEKALNWTMSWYRAYLEGENDLSDFTCKQFDQYEHLSTMMAMNTVSAVGE